MAYYVEPEYWVEGYAVGDPKLIAAQAIGASAMKTGGGIDAYTGLQSAASSIVSIAPARITFTGFSSVSASDVDIGISASFGIAAKSASDSATNAGAFRIAQISSKASANGIMLASFRFKWEDETEPTDIWVSTTEPTDNWTDITEPSITWTAISEPTDNWTDVIEPSDNWS